MATRPVNSVCVHERTTWYSPRVIGEFQFLRHFHIDDFVCLEFPIQIGTFDINLMDFKVMTCGHCQNNSDRRDFRHRCICVKTVNSGALVIAQDDQSSSIMVYCTCSITFNMVNPLVTNHFES
jgi:hypothetical protein